MIEDQTEMMGIKMIRRKCTGCTLTFLISEKDTKTTHCSSICKQCDPKTPKRLPKDNWNKLYVREERHSSSV